MACCSYTGCKNVTLMNSQCSICFESVRSANSPNTKRLRCGHSFHLGCILDWFVESDECPVCRQVQTNDKLLFFKKKVQYELREKYKHAIQSYENEINRLRSNK